MLLDKQDELRVLEEELGELDDELVEGRESYAMTRKDIMDKELRERRAKLMKAIEDTYCSYCQ
jgi:hypothetical protein